ncbi:uncharacterized protein VNE69_01031 [Vairimorpha necatrix]|uniref:Uncharacterized protein n=1 Tax=Vairimorpha necatrix TaxID=6039 RepID=A0AAX4J810_9MICR
MALFYIPTFTKKSSDTLQKFKKLVEKVLTLQNVSENLETIYDYISYEQSKPTSDCTKYFITNELAASFSLIQNYNIETFFIKIIGSLNKDNLKNFIVVNILTSRVCLIYSERLVVYNMEVDTFYIKYLTDNFHKDKMFRYATLLLFNLDVFSKFHKYRLPKKMIQFINNNMDVETFGIYMMYILKEKENKKVWSLENKQKIKLEPNINEYKYNVNDYKDIVNDYKQNSKDNQQNMIENSYGKYYVKFQDIKPIKDDADYKHLDLKNKPTSYYKSLLSLNILDEITEMIIDNFLLIFNGDQEHLDFLLFLINEYSTYIGKYMCAEYKNEDIWNVIDIYDIIIKNMKKHCQPKKFSPVKTKGNFLQKILDLQVRNEEIYYFLFFINREAFYRKFMEINKLMKDSEYFHGTIYNLLTD